MTFRNTLCVWQDGLRSSTHSQDPFTLVSTVLFKSGPPNSVGVWWLCLCSLSAAMSVLEICVWSSSNHNSLYSFGQKANMFHWNPRCVPPDMISTVSDQSSSTWNTPNITVKIRLLNLQPLRVPLILTTCHNYALCIKYCISCLLADIMWSGNSPRMRTIPVRPWNYF